MSTVRDNAQTDGVINLGDGMKATPNGDGTYTVSGGTGEDAEANGVWAPSTADNPDAIEMEAPGTQFDGTWWVKQ